MDKEVGIRLKVGATGLENFGQLISSLKAAGVETSALEAQAQQLAAELQRLDSQQGLIDAFKRQKTAVADAAEALKAAKDRAAELGRALSDTEAPTKRQQQAFESARATARDADAAYQAQVLALQGLRGQMSAAGVATEDLAAAQVKVRAETTRVKDALAATEQSAKGAVTQQQQLADTADQARLRTKALADNLAQLANGMRSTEGATDALGQHLDTAFRTLGVRSVAQVTAEIDRLKAALFTVKASDAFGPDIERAAAAAQQRIAALEGELRQVPAAAGAASKGIGEVADASRNVEASLLGATRTAVSLAAALTGVASGGQLVKGVIDTGAAFESLRVRLEQVLGSSKAAEEAFTKIKELAITTPFEVKDLTESYIKLNAFGLKPTSQQLLALADTAAVAGGGTEALQRVVLALGQAWAKSKLQGDEILQLTEAGVPVWDLLAKATGRNVVELQKLSEAGALGRDVILKLFDALGEKNAGASARLMQTFSGAISNAKDALAEFFDLIARSGVLEYLTRKIQEALVEFDKLKDTGELERKAKAIAQAFLNFASAAETAFAAAKQLVTVVEVLLAGLAAEKLIAFASAMTGVASATALVRAEAVATAAVTGPLAAGVATAGVAATGAAAGVGLLARAVGLLRLGLVGGAVLGLAELVSEFFRAKRSAEDAEVAAKKMLESEPAPKLKAAVHDVVAELDDFKKKLPGLENDIAGLTGEGLANFARATLENLRAIQAESALTTKAIGTITERAAKTLEIELPSMAAKTTTEFKGVQAEVQLLIGQLPNLGLAAQQAGNITAQALSKLVDAAKTQADFAAVEQQIKQLGLAGKISFGAMEELLREMRDRAKEAKQAIEDQTPGIQSLGEAARKAGVDVALLTGGITKDGQASLTVVRDLVSQVIATGVAAERASPILAAALDKRLQAAATTDELKALEREIQRARDAGKLLGSDLEGALDAAKRKAQELSPALRQAMADAKLLGIELKDNISGGVAAGVEGSLRAYERLKASGKASAAELQQAFINVADQAIAAANGVVPEWVKVEATFRNVELSVNQTAKAVQQAAATVNNAMTTLVAGFNTTSRIKQQADALANASAPTLSGRTATSDFNINQKAGTIGSTYTPPPDNSGDYEWVATASNPGGQWQLTAAGSARRDAARAAQNSAIRTAYERAGIPVPGGNAGLPTLGLPKAVQDQLNFNNGQISLRDGAANAPTSAPSAAPTATASGNTTVINLGALRATVNTPTQGDAETLQTILRTLAFDAGRAA